MKKIFILTFSAICVNLSAQISSTAHQAFTLQDGTTNIILDLDGDVQIKERGGSRILVETTVSIDNGSPAILDYWINEEKRYETFMEVMAGGTVKIYTQKRKDIALRRSVSTETRGTDDKSAGDTNDGDVYFSKGKEIKCTEKITYTVYIPSYMTAVNANGVPATASTGH